MLILLFLNRINSLYRKRYVTYITCVNCVLEIVFRSLILRCGLSGDAVRTYSHLSNKLGGWNKRGGKGIGAVHKLCHLKIRNF